MNFGSARSLSHAFLRDLSIQCGRSYDRAQQKLPTQTKPGLQIHGLKKKLAILLVISSGISCIHKNANKTDEPFQTRISNRHAPNVPLALLPEQKRKIEIITTVFENEKLEPQYDYIEALNDGRGYTAGKVGFCTGCPDLLMVTDEFLKRSSNSKIRQQFQKLRPLLVQKANSHSSSIRGLQNLPSLWKEASKDPVFRQAQDIIAENLYLHPSLIHSKEIGLRSPLGVAIIYDSIVQHGDGKDPDGLDAMIARTQQKLLLNGEKFDETKWLTAFLEVRRETLLNAHEVLTRHGWQESVGRVDALLKLLQQGNLDLTGDLQLNPYGTLLTIKAKSSP